MAREAVWTVGDVATVPDHPLPLPYDLAENELTGMLL